MKLTPFRYLLLIHAFVVIFGDLPYYRMVRVVRLYDHLPSFFKTTGPATNLCHKLKSAFMGPEVWEVQHVIRIQDAHNTNIVEVQPFAHHLCADQDINPALFKILNDMFVSMF